MAALAQFRLRCIRRKSRRGFKIWIEDRPHTDKQFVGDPDIVIVDLSA